MESGYIVYNLQFFGGRKRAAITINFAHGQLLIRYAAVQTLLITKYNNTKRVNIILVVFSNILERFNVIIIIIIIIRTN